MIGRQAGSWRGDEPWNRYRVAMEFSQGPIDPATNQVTVKVDYYIETFDPTNPEHVASWNEQTATDTWWRRWLKAVGVNSKSKPDLE